MSADPAMFNQVAKGNLATSEKAQLLKKASDKSKQQGLFAGGEMGKPGGGRLFSLAPTFYSQMAVSLEAKLPGKGSGAQLADLIEGWVKKGDPKFPIKAEELKWSGLIPFLREQQGPVTKAQVLDFLKENQVEVREVTRGRAKLVAEAGKIGMKYGTTSGILQSFKDPEYHRFLKTKEGGGKDLAPEDIRRLREIDAALEKTEPEKFSSFMKLPPGGENYREVLLTVPSKEGVGIDSLQNQWQKLETERKQVIADRIRLLDQHYPEGAPTYDKIPEPLGSRIIGLDEKEIALSRQQAKIGNQVDAIQQGRSAGEGNFQVPSSHAYGDPAADVNRFAHIFMDDRVIDGKKYLTIHELQSDWAAGGRKEGYNENF